MYQSDRWSGKIHLQDCSTVERVLLAGEQWHLTLGRISVFQKLLLVTRRNRLERITLGAVFHTVYLQERYMGIQTRN